MFGFRMVLHIKERTHCLIQPIHMTRSYESFVTKCYAKKTKHYCTSTKNRRESQQIHNISNINDANVKGQIQSNFKNMDINEKFLKTDLCETKNEMNIPNDSPESASKIIYRGLQAMYPDPVPTIHNFYQIVRKELNDNSVLTIHYKKCSSKIPHWKCIYSVSWPEKVEFIAQDISKVKTSKQAALKCLHWLHTQKRIKDSKPIIYDNEQIEDKLQKPIPIHLNFEFVEKVKGLVNKYEMDIKDTVQYSQINDNTSNFLSTNKDFIHKQSLSHSEYITRNKQLQDRLLLNKEVKIETYPIYKYRDEILQKLENNQIIMIKGDTGCGKSTKVPQFIMDSFIKKGNATDCNILISQPRRISATSLAERVASEREETVGDVVGYQVRLEAKPPQFPGGMLFCTTGILRQVIQNNPDLIGYSHVILDEAHERSLDIDVLLVLLKRALQNNPKLKLIVMSATLNTQLFQEYYNCTSVDVPGKVYPVKMHFMEDFQHVLPSFKTNMNIGDNRNYKADNKDKPIIDCNDIANLIRWILKTKPPGAILCFLPGWMEIKKVQELLSNMNSIAHKVVILPLHSKLPNINQRNIFKPVPPNISKVILATDIAETGITVPDIIYVVDSAIKNDILWDKDVIGLRMSHTKVSQANIEQRKGRAGRTQPGESYHFIRKDEYNYLEPYPIPEILRCSLERTVVEIKSYTNEKVLEFCSNMLQPPNPIALKKAVHTLRQLNIIDKYEDLTPLGKLVARIPVHPTLAKALVLSTVFECIQPILYIATIYSMDSDFFSNTLGNRSLKKEIKEHFHKTSDHLAMVKLFEEWQKSCEESSYEGYVFCNEMDISPFKINLTAKICNSFIKYMKDCNLLEEVCNLNNLEALPNKYAFVEEIIHGIILSSTNQLLQRLEFSYVKGVFRKKPQFLTENNERAEISNESINRGKKFWPSPFLTYLQGMRIHNVRSMMLNDVSIISPLTTLLFSPGEKYYKHGNSENSGNIIIKIGNRRKLLFSCTAEEAHLLMTFSDIIWSLVDYFIRKECSNAEFTNELDRMYEYKLEVLDVLSQMLSTYNMDKK